MPKLIDLIGIVYGRFTVVSYHSKGNGRKSLWLCRCECGEYRIVSSGNLRSGNSISCGCYRIEVIKENSSHGMSQTIEFNTWVNIRQRCYNVNNIDYENWGGRGIRVCDRWLGKNGFKNFLSDMGRRPSFNHSLDRFPNNETGHYGPDNCRWATKKEQGRNMRSNHWIEYDGKIMIVSDWASLFKLKNPSCLTEYLKTHNMSQAFEHYKKRIKK